MGTNLETEVKLACDDLDRLRKAGLTLRITKPRHFEDNWLLDTSDHLLMGRGAALRVRVANGKGLVTYKGVTGQTASSPLKVREEIESEVADPDRIIELFERLGYFRAFRYQKYRTVYAATLGQSRLEVTYDETPMGNFIEIEGDEDAVMGALRAADFSDGDIIRDSYPELQMRRCKARGVPLEDLVF
jgi:adenylate cyclase class 2